MTLSVLNQEKGGDANEEWTSGYLIEKLSIELISIRVNSIRKYEEQAKELMYRIPVHRPTPYYIINQSDLAPHLIHKLSSLDNDTLDYVIKESLSYIFKPINKKYFSLSIKKRYGLLLWRLEE